MDEVERIKRGLSPEAQSLLGCGWQGVSLWHPAIAELNDKELLHLDVMKAANGNVRHWKGRATPLGLRVRAALQDFEAWRPLPAPPVSSARDGG